jgi:hypothetical protein
MQMKIDHLLSVGAEEGFFFLAVQGFELWLAACCTVTQPLEPHLQPL